MRGKNAGTPYYAWNYLLIGHSAYSWVFSSVLFYFFLIRILKISNFPNFHFFFENPILKPSMAFFLSPLSSLQKTVSDGLFPSSGNYKKSKLFLGGYTNS